MDEKKTRKAMREAFNMTKQRCYNPKCRDYKYYGALGIKICDRWLQSFTNFVEDMGLRPEGTSLDRVDVYGDYSPDNCVWSTRKEQMANQRRTITLTRNGETKTLPEWSKITGISYWTLKARKQILGYTDEQCLSKSVACGIPLPDKEYPVRVYRGVKGLENAVTKFNVEQIKEIREAYCKVRSFSALAKKYGTSAPTIRKVVKKEGAYSAV